MLVLSVICGVLHSQHQCPMLY